MSEVFEMLMVVCFGFSWPISIYKSWKSKTTKGKSVAFTAFVWVGYVCGITSKLVADHLSYVLVFYIINLIAVSVDVVLYFRNREIDRRVEAELADAKLVAVGQKG